MGSRKGKNNEKAMGRNPVQAHSTGSVSQTNTSVTAGENPQAADEVQDKVQDEVFHTPPEFPIEEPNSLTTEDLQEADDAQDEKFSTAPTSPVQSPNATSSHETAHAENAYENAAEGDLVAQRGGSLSAGSAGHQHALGQADDAGASEIGEAGMTSKGKQRVVNPSDAHAVSSSTGTPQPYDGANKQRNASTMTNAHDSPKQPGKKNKPNRRPSPTAINIPVVAGPSTAGPPALHSRYPLSTPTRPRDRYQHSWHHVSGTNASRRGGERCQGPQRENELDHPLREVDFWRCNACRDRAAKFAMVCKRCKDVLERKSEQDGAYPEGYKCVPLR